FVLVANTGEMLRGVRSYRRATGRRGIGGSVAAVARNRRLYGGLVAHVGVAIAAVAITTSSTFALRTEVTVPRGGSVAFAGYTLRYDDVRTVRQPQRLVRVATVSVSVTGTGRSAGVVTPSLNFYPSASEAIGTPSIHYGVLRDLYASMLAVDPDG